MSMIKVPKDFWTETINWTVYVHKRSPTIVVKSSIQYEAWSAKKPYVMPFRIFGFIAYAHIPFSQRKTLDDNAISVSSWELLRS